MNARRVGLGAFTFIEIGVLLAVLIVLNALACNNTVRFDLTENREYTVSPATRKVLSSLDEIVNVRAYLSDDLPADYLPLRTEIYDQLRTFEELANDNFRLTIVENIDPAKEMLDIKGIQPINFTVRKEGESTEKRGYMGIFLERVNKTDALPVVLSTESLEYDLISAIVRLSKKESDTGKISITQGNGEPDMESPEGIQQFVKDLRAAKYTVYPTTLDDKTEIPSTARTLLVQSPTKLTDFDKYQIDQFLMRGGNLVVTIDRWELPRNEQGQPELNGKPIMRNFAAADLLEFYGIRAEAKVIGDPSSEAAQYQTGRIINNHPYPLWIRVNQNNLSDKNPAVSKLEAVGFPWANPLRLIEDNIRQHPDVEVDILAQSTPAAWAVAPDDDEFRGLGPWDYKDFASIRPDNVQYPLAVELTGTFKSFFAGKPDPIGERTVSQDRPRLDQSEKPGRIIVIGTGKWLTGPEQVGWWAQFRTNQIFMYNLMDYLNLGDELLGLRSRQIKVRPLEKQWVPENQVKERRLTPQDENTITLLNILLMPGLLVLFAMSAFTLKARRKQSYESRMRSELALDSKLTAAERAEMALSAEDRGGFRLPLGSVAALLLAFAGILGLVMWQLNTERSQREAVLGEEAASLFPDFAKADIEKIEIWEILGKYVIQKSGDNWMIGHVGYTPDKSEEERGAAMPTDFALADSRAIEAVLTGTEQMQTGVLITRNDVNAVQAYVGRIGSEYRMFDAKGRLVAKFVVGKNTDDFTGTYVQVRPPEQSENFAVYKVPGYLEPTFKKKSVLDWWDRKLFAMKPESIQRITVTRPGQPRLVVEKADTGWRLAEPAGWTADSAKLADWMDVVAGLEVDSWLEQYMQFELQQNPPNWDAAEYTISVLPVGATDPIPTLQITTSNLDRVGAKNLARVGEGIIFHVKESDLRRLSATEADFRAELAAPPATADPAAVPAGESTTDESATPE